MRRFFSVLAVLAAVTASLLSLTGCAARRAEARAKLPVAKTVCLQMDGVKEPEKGIVLRRAKGMLEGQKFSVVNADCDLKVGFTALDGSKWDAVSPALFGLRTASSYQIEGVVTVWNISGEVVAQDLPVNLRDYKSKTDILENMAWQLIEYVQDNYRSN